MQLKKTLVAAGSAAAFALGGCATTTTAPQVQVKWPNLIVHLHAGNGMAYLVDPATDAVVASLPTEKGGALGATTPDGKKVYVAAEAEGGTTNTVIDLEKRAVAAKIQTGNRPKHPAISPDGRLVQITRLRHFPSDFLGGSAESCEETVGWIFGAKFFVVTRFLCNHLDGS